MKQLTQPIKWHGGWLILIENISIGRALYSWCRCECGNYRLVKKNTSKSCGCVARRKHAERQKLRTGADHHGWLGGHWNRGSEAWARKILRQSRRTSDDGGYARPDIESFELVLLFDSFSGYCPICGVAVDKWNGRKLCLDHDHKSGRVRGFICHHCNACLGWLESYENKIKEYRI